MLVNERHFRPSSSRMIVQCCTVLDPSLWMQNVPVKEFENWLIFGEDTFNL